MGFESTLELYFLTKLIYVILSNLMFGYRAVWN